LIAHSPFQARASKAEKKNLFSKTWGTKNGGKFRHFRMLSSVSFMPPLPHMNEVPAALFPKQAVNA
jgi:hypothetical protein